MSTHSRLPPNDALLQLTRPGPNVALVKEPLPLQLKETKLVDPLKTDVSQERFRPKEAYLKSVSANLTFLKNPL